MTSHAGLFAAWAGMPESELADWEMVPWMQCDQVVAMAAMQGTEIHFAIAPPWRGRVITPRRCRVFLGPLLERFGFLTTRAFGAPNTFLERLGFILTGCTDGRIYHYMLTQVPFSGES